MEKKSEASYSFTEQYGFEKINENEDNQKNFSNVKVQTYRKVIQWKKECASQNIPIPYYRKRILQQFYFEYDFQDKIVLEIGSDPFLQAANTLLQFGAKEIYCVNPEFSPNLIPDDKRIHVFSDILENLDFPPNFFDIILGIALIEHIHHPKELVEKIKTILKPENGICMLHGGPLWTSYEGHHVVLNHYNINFHNKTNPFAPWEHLKYKTDFELTKYLLQKGFSDKVAIAISHEVFHTNSISRYSPTNIIDTIRQIQGIRIKCIGGGNKFTPNEYYEYAKKIYSEKDLNTHTLYIYIWKNAIDNQ